MALFAAQEGTRLAGEHAEVARFADVCSSSRPKPPPPVNPPPPPQSAQVDQQVIDARDRERRRASSRSGRQSTMLAGDATPTGQSKTMLGA